LPLVQNLGVGFVIRFPAPPGEARLPLYGQGDSHGAAEVRTAQAGFLQVVGSPPRIHIPIHYQADGSFSVGTLSDEELTNLTGMPAASLYLDPALLNRLIQAGVESISLTTDAEGIRVVVNGQPLPSLTWADGELAHLLGVTEEMALGDMWAPDLNREDVFALVRSLLPVVQSTEFDLTVSFPPSPQVAVAASR
jgi:hypothetical protein